jgi:hypothetical protein
MSRPSRRLFLVGTLAAGLAFGVGAAPANADLSRKVIAAFKGQILVTGGKLESMGSDKETIAHFKKTALTTVKGEENGNDVQEWTFSYTAFMKAGGSPRLKLEFYNENGDYVADQTLTDVDPKMTVLEGDITINEDDGLARGKKYTLKLTGTLKGKDFVFAQTAKPILMN